MRKTFLVLIILSNICGTLTNVNANDISQNEKMVEDMFNNKAFKEAWEDYKQIVNDAQISNPIEPQEAITVEEIDAKFELSQDTESININDQQVMKFYTYETEEPFAKDIDDQPGRASIYLLFNDNKLSFVGVSNGSFLYEKNNFINQETVAKLTKEPFDLKKLDVKQPIVMNFGTFFVNKREYSIVSMLSGDLEKPTVEMFAVIDNQLDYITSKTLEEISDNESKLMVEALSDYVMEYSGEFYQLHKNDK